MMHQLRLASIVGVMALASPALAGNLLTNGSFETGTMTNTGSFDNLPAGSTNITGWEVGAGGVDYIGGYWQAAEGRRSVDLSGTAAGFTSQSFATVLGATYDVKFWMAGNTDGGDVIKDLRVSAIGGTTQSQDFSFNTTGKTRTNMGWVQMSWSFVADGNPTAIQFLSLEQNAYGPALDDVSVMAAVPAPPAALLGLGLLGGIGLWRRRRRSSI